MGSPQAREPRGPATHGPSPGDEFGERAALDNLLSGRPAPAQQRPSMGCNIKWRPGNEPEWFPR